MEETLSSVKFRDTKLLVPIIDLLRENASNHPFLSSLKILVSSQRRECYVGRSFQHPRRSPGNFLKTLGNVTVHVSTCSRDTWHVLPHGHLIGGKKTQSLQLTFSCPLSAVIKKKVFTVPSHTLHSFCRSTIYVEGSNIRRKISSRVGETQTFTVSHDFSSSRKDYPSFMANM